jgi:uncharacterized membrane protein HdeD (DUF308 family)
MRFALARNWWSLVIRGFLAISGIASIIFGVLVAAVPLAGALVIALWFGAYAFVFGVILVALGLRLRNWDRIQPWGQRIPSPAH